MIKLRFLCLAANPPIAGGKIKANPRWRQASAYGAPCKPNKHRPPLLVVCRQPFGKAGYIYIRVGEAAVYPCLMAGENSAGDSFLR